MWFQIGLTAIITLLVLMVWQRWKVSAEWLKMEQDLYEEDFEIWKKTKQRQAEEWSERWKWAEAGFLFLLSASSVHLAESSFELTPKITHNLGGSTHVEIKVPPNSIVHDAIALHEGHGPDSNNRRRLLLRSLQVSFELHPNSGRHLSKKLQVTIGNGFKSNTHTHQHADAHTINTYALVILSKNQYGFTTYYRHTP